MGTRVSSSPATSHVPAGRPGASGEARPPRVSPGASGPQGRHRLRAPALSVHSTHGTSRCSQDTRLLCWPCHCTLGPEQVFLPLGASGGHLSDERAGAAWAPAADTALGLECYCPRQRFQGRRVLEGPRAPAPQERGALPLPGLCAQGPLCDEMLCSSRAGSQ